MGHDHHHHEADESQLKSKAFIIGILLNALYVIFEVVYGLKTHSLSLLSDAGHNLGDVGGLIISLVGFKMASLRPNNRFTYGYKKTTILASLTNATILLISCGILGFEAIQRIIHPKPINGDIISWVAALGIIINTISAMLFFRHKSKDINIRGAYLHLAADAAVSAGVVVGGLLMYFFQWYFLDGWIGAIIVLVILVGTWKLLMESISLSVDGVPKEIDIQHIKEKILNLEGVKDVHHIHVWAISSSNNAFTGHIVTGEHFLPGDEYALKQKLRKILDDFHIGHATFEFETFNEVCKDEC